jgi:hypothetical protein
VRSCVERDWVACITVMIELRNLRVVCFAIGVPSLWFRDVRENHFFAAETRRGIVTLEAPGKSGNDSFQRAIRQFQMRTEFWRTTGLLCSFVAYFLT